VECMGWKGRGSRRSPGGEVSQKNTREIMSGKTENLVTDEKELLCWLLSTFLIGDGRGGKERGEKLKNCHSLTKKTTNKEYLGNFGTSVTKRELEKKGKRDEPRAIN